MMEGFVMCDYYSIMLEAIRNNQNSVKWLGKPYEGIKYVSNTAVGNVGQTFVRKICDAIGFKNQPPLTGSGEEAYNSPWDLKIEGVTFEIKTASEDTNGGFQFNHVRLHRKYDALLCIGISPDAIWFGVWSKADVATGGAGTLTSMEQGGASDFKLSKRKKSLKRIEEFERIMKEFFGNTIFNSNRK